MAKKVLVLIPSLISGGAQRICVSMCNYLISSYKDLQITIACLKAEGSLLNNLHPSIKLVDLNHLSVYFSIGRIVKLVKQEKPDCIIGWMGYLNAYLIFFKFLFPKKITWLCRESSLPSHLHTYFKNGWLFNFFYKFYNRYNKIICQSQAMANDLQIHFHVKPEKIIIINNPFQDVKVEPVEPGKDFPDTKYKLLFVGRLHHVKRPEILVHAMTYLNDNYSLTLVGEGEERKCLEGLIRQKNLQNKVKLIGAIQNPGYYYQNASCLLISSKYEGFPNVIIEALAFGCPVIGYQIQGGADEILQNYGAIHVKGDSSITDFAETIKKVCKQNLFDTKKIGENALKKYSLSDIGNQYYQLLQTKG